MNGACMSGYIWDGGYGKRTGDKVHPGSDRGAWDGLWFGLDLFICLDERHAV